MRRIAAYIYKKAGRWKQSVALSKQDKLYKDAMETCSQSGDRELSEQLLIYFIEQVMESLHQSTVLCNIFGRGPCSLMIGISAAYYFQMYIVVLTALVCFECLGRVFS